MSEIKLLSRWMKQNNYGHLLVPGISTERKSWRFEKEGKLIYKIDNYFEDNMIVITWNDSDTPVVIKENGWKRSQTDRQRERVAF